MRGGDCDRCCAVSVVPSRRIFAGGLAPLLIRVGTTQGHRQPTHRRNCVTRKPRSRDTDRNSTFRCSHCSADVPTDALGTRHRNHCPTCLWSRHVDDSPGDRAADCGSSMEPIAICVRGNGEWVLIHRCTGCEVVHLNRTAGDDSVLLLMRLAVRPLAAPPFPLELLGAV